jgi:hypothetical protein
MPLLLEPNRNGFTHPHHGWNIIIIIIIIGGGDSSNYNSGGKGKGKGNPVTGPGGPIGWVEV